MHFKEPCCTTTSAPGVLEVMLKAQSSPVALEGLDRNQRRIVAKANVKTGSLHVKVFILVMLISLLGSNL